MSHILRKNTLDVFLIFEQILSLFFFVYKPKKWIKLIEITNKNKERKKTVGKSRRIVRFSFYAETDLLHHETFMRITAGKESLSL